MSGAHLDEELLAGLALGDEELAPHATHLDGCARCSATLAELRELRDHVREADPRAILSPDPALLDRIRAELGDELPGRTRPEPAPRRRTSRRRSAGWRTGIALAAAVGLVVGAGGVLAVQRWRTPATQPLAATTLSALPGWSGGGRAELVRDGTIDVLRVRVSAPNPPEEFRELWLINRDGQRMISLGVLDASGRGSYPLPPVLTGDLQGYVVVDVSAEPFDGNAAHSHNSIVRGQLP